MTIPLPVIHYKKPAKNNRIANSPYYGNILEAYNERLRKDGKVNESDFYRTVVKNVIPISLKGWFGFITKFKTAAGLPQIREIGKANTISPLEQEDLLKGNLLENEIATRRGINKALNVGLKALEKLLEDTETMPLEKRAELLFKAMRAQDSRIHAIGKVREDNREEIKLDRAFNSAMYSDKEEDEE